MRGRTPGADTAPERIDADEAEAFAGRMQEAVNGGSLSPLISLGQHTALRTSPSTSSRGALERAGRRVVVERTRRHAMSVTELTKQDARAEGIGARGDDGADSGGLRKLSAADVAPVAAALAEAFADDPLLGHWMLPRESTRLRSLTRGFALYARRLWLRHDHCLLAAGGRAGAMWLPPGAAETGTFEELRLLPGMAAALGRSLPRMLRLLAAMEERHPSEPHYYLPVIGVAPELQGRGLGGLLLSAVLDRADREGMPAYLEASSERNRGLYERHGFEVVDELRVGDSPPLWPMWREPQT